jgi:small-conductance mechanosensitive channel/CRP-like cAMP-binding protein
VGALLLRALARRGAPWWGSVAGPLLSIGPAIGLVVAAGISAGTLDSVLPWSESPPWPTLVAWSLVLFFGVTSLAGFVREFLMSRLVTEEIGLRIPTLLLDAGRIVVWMVMVFVVVGGIWHQTQWFTGLFTASALGGVALVFAAQETLKNFFSGVSIVSEGMFGIGDWIWVGDEEGEVVEITRRTVKIRTRAADLVVMPNVMVTSSKVRNESRPTPVHAEFVYVQAPYDAPPTHVREVLRHAVLEVPKVLREPPPVLRVRQFMDSGVEYQVKIFLSDLASVPDIKSDCLAQIWYHFRREGIEIPYPVRELRRPTGRPEVRVSDDVLHQRLRDAPFFAGIPDDLIGMLARSAIMEEYGAGESVVRAGDPGNTCYVVDRGRLAVLVSDGREERQVAVLETGALFGEMSLLTGEPRTATVRVIDDARLVSLAAPALRSALARSPELTQALAEAAVRRKEGLTQARAEFDSHARDRLREGTKNLGALIRRFFRLTDEPPGPR